jgi:hypothetical protein
MVTRALDRQYGPCAPPSREVSTPLASEKTTHQEQSMRARVGQLRFMSLIATAAAGVACADHPTSPSVATSANARASTSVAAVPLTATVTVLPADSSLQWSMKGVSGAGFIFADVTTGSASQPYVWSAPYGTDPASLAAEGAVISLAHPNNGGDAPGVSGSMVGFWARGSSSWTFSPVDVESYSPIRVSGINDTRQLVGFGYSPTGVQYALWWEDPSAAPAALPAPPVTGTLTGYRAIAISNTGDIVGDATESTRSGSRTHAVRWTATSSGWVAALLPDVAGTNYAYDVNDVHQIVGNAGSDAVLWSPPSYGATIVSTNQAALTQIDPCGRVIGYTNRSKPTAWLWANGTTTTLPMPAGATGTQAQGIAADTAMHQGTIVGVELRGSLPAVPVRWNISACP